MKYAEQIRSQLTAKRQRTMLAVDMRRMFRTSRFWIMLLIALVTPVLILVMTTSMSGMSVTDPQTGAVTVMEGFTSAWQIIASPSGADSAMAMDLTGMCNINLMYFMAGILICLFVADDFRSGYAKNLFTVRAKKTDYVVSKTLVGILSGAAFLIAFFVGAMLGGAIAGLPFTLGLSGVFGLIMCMAAKLFLMAVFVPIFLAMSVFARQRTWLSILLSLFAGMLLFMMIPMMSPLNAGFMHAFMCLAGGALFSVGLGTVSRMILGKVDLV